MVWEEEVEEIRKRRTLAKKQGGKEAIKNQHAKGRLTLRERINFILDQKTFLEIGETTGSAELDDEGNILDYNPANFILGFGDINGRKVIMEERILL